MAQKDDPVAFLAGFHDGDPEALARALREHIARGDFLFGDAMRARWALYWAERAVRLGIASK